VPDDDRILERLACALAPPDSRPSSAEVKAVRRVAAFWREHVVNQGGWSGNADQSSDRRLIQLPPLVVSPARPSRAPRRAKVVKGLAQPDVRLLP
jgi:hypothetical protein